MSEQSGQESVLRDEIIRMAQESGLSLGHSFAWSNLMRFADLVADSEREACVRICTEVARIETQQFALDGAVAAHECAQRIRERGDV